MNNMYDIIGKLNSLTPQEKEIEAKKPLYESVEARGSIVAGVKTVEQKLREQFESMREGEKVAVKGGTVHKGTYGNEYDPGDDGTKKPKHVPKKGVKGRPKKEKPAEFNAPKGDIFGRTTGSVPKGQKGTGVKGKAMSHDDNKKDEELDEVVKNPYAIGMAQAKKEIGLGKSRAKNLPKKTVKRAHHIGDVISGQVSESRKQFMAMLSEGVNFTEMMKERGRGIDDLLAELQSDIKNFKETGHVSDFLRDCMEVHGYGKKQMAPAPSFLDKAKSFGQKALGTLGHPSDDQMLADLKRKTMDENFSDDLHDQPVAKWYAKHGDQKKIVHWLRQEAGRPNDASIYFDGADLVYGSHTIVDRALVDPRLTFMDLLDAVIEAVSGSPDDMSELNELARLAGLKVSESNDGNLANNAKPYNKVTQGDVVAGRLGKDEQGGEKEIDEENIEVTPPSQLYRKDPSPYDFTGLEKKAETPAYARKAMGATPLTPSSALAGNTKTLKDKAELDECMSPLGGAAVEMQQAEQQKGRMSVNTSADSEGHKTVTITADGEEAEKLAQILALAGIGGHHPQQPEEHAAIVVAQEAKDYGDTDVEEPEELANSPRPDVRGAHRAETVGFANTSDDLHKQKDQHPDAAAKGDNPLAKKEKAVEAINPLESLGAQLMAEYQSIKIQK